MSLEDEEDEEWPDEEDDDDDADDADDADEWPEDDDLGDEDADGLPPQEADDDDDEEEVDIDELSERLQARPSGLPFFDGFVKSALEWLEDEETTVNLQAASLQLDRDLRSHWSLQVPDWLEEDVTELQKSFEKDDGESMLVILLRIQKALREA